MRRSIQGLILIALLWDLECEKLYNLFGIDFSIRTVMRCMTQKIERYVKNDTLRYVVCCNLAIIPNVKSNWSFLFRFWRI